MISCAVHARPNTGLSMAMFSERLSVLLTPPEALGPGLVDVATASPNAPHWLVDAARWLGRGVASRRSGLIETARRLADNLEPSAAERVQELISRLESVRFHIAITGHANAGRSSFVNAFAGMPALLPTGIDQKTMVLTRVHFDHANERAPSAIFELFSESEWRQAGRGQNGAALGHRDMDANRASPAESCRAVGRDSETDISGLFGQRHRFNSVSAHIIESYVGGKIGKLVAQGADAITGYADLTKSADIYLDEGAIHCPLTLVDVPGTAHDPALAGGLAQKSLDEADVCIFVLSARTSLAEIDRTLMHELRDRRKDGFAVFINHVDELATASERQRIVEHVSALLEREFGSPVPVLAGSARWAMAALDGSCAAEEALEPRVAGHAVAAGVVDTTELEDLARSGPDSGTDRLRQLLHAASGFPAAYAKIADMLWRSPAAFRMCEAAVAIADIAREALFSTRHEFAALEKNLASTFHKAVSEGDEMRRIRNELEQLDGILVQLDRAFDDRRGWIEFVQRDVTENLQRELHEAVTDYATRERVAIVVALDQTATKKGTRIDMLGLRLLLEQIFVERYRRMHRTFMDAEKDGPEHFAQLLRQRLPDVQIDRGPTPTSGSFLYPQLRALDHVRFLDLDAKLCAKWRRAHPGIRELMKEFKRLLVAEFSGVAHQLVAVAERDCAGQAEALVKLLAVARARASCLVMQRKEYLQARLEYTERILHPDVMEHFLGDQLLSLSKCRDRLQVMSQLARSLDEIVERLGAPEAAGAARRDGVVA